MKTFVITLSAVVLIYCLIDFAEAAPERPKRQVSMSKCPEHKSHSKCMAQARRESRRMDYCHKIISGDDWYGFQGCDLVSCRKRQTLVQEDLSKPYPDCCSYCE